MRDIFCICRFFFVLLQRNMMKKEFIFCVAGHPFRMRIEESLLHGMANYAPFLCTADEESSIRANEAGCIFNLDIQAGTTGYTGEGWQPVLNERVQVGGILQLKQAPKNEIHSLRPAEAYAYILSSSSGLKFDHTMMDGIHETVSTVVFGTRVMGLSCLHDAEATLASWKDIDIITE